MKFRNLAAQLRPMTFSRVLGQDEISLLKIMCQDAESFPPLIILSGPSGVGKTTTARIVAAALNCEQIENGEPCTKCDSCISIYTDSHPSVTEYDAASHGTADALRGIRSQASLASIGIKVFILDEAQSISSQGWNVLLKLLEDPPLNCTFILSTTEFKKVPEKVRTRAIHFVFKPVAPKIVSNYLTKLRDYLKLDITDSGILVIVDRCLGSVRQALMMLEQASISKKTPEELFNSVDKSLDFLEALSRGDNVMAQHTINRSWTECGDGELILQNLANKLKTVLFCKYGLDYYGSEISDQSIKNITELFTDQQLAKAIEVTATWINKVKTEGQLSLFVAAIYKELFGSINLSGTNGIGQPKLSLESLDKALDGLQR